MKKFTSISAIRGCLLAAPAVLVGTSFADNSPQTLPYAQDWNNPGLITLNDIWTGVPGVIGYRGDDIVAATGADPQTLLGEGTITVDVNANQTNPDVFNTGGVTEFDGIPNPSIALTGSGTADAPYILLHLNTTGLADITISYLLRDLDGSTDNAVQPVALQYRIGNAGLFTNVAGGFVADASTGPSLANLVTPVTVQLPPDANNVALLQVRIITANAAGNDEWIGIDNINVTAGIVDTDGDGVPDGTDNCPGVPNAGQEDCDDNGIGDACDVPCPIDTDGDGIPDDLDNCPDIFNPLQQDCQPNGIGDVCDLAPGGGSLDCNNNTIPDECELDCDGNNVPDSCDIAGNPSLDSNGNGILDVCENPIAIIINEIHADPAAGAPGDANNDGLTDSAQDEFVELVNNTGASLDMSGFTLSDSVGVRHTFPFGTVVANQCSIVIFGGGTRTGQFGGGVVQRASSNQLGLNNTGDTVTLRDANLLYVTSVTYGSEGGDDTSLTRNPDVIGSLPLVKHRDVTMPNSSGGTLFSVGRPLIPGSQYVGCTILPDSDNDGIPDGSDNCPSIPNASQANCDGDRFGDACDTDPDTNGNGIPDVCEIVGAPVVRLNEIRLEQPGADNDEYFEIKGTPGQSLNGLTLFVLGDPSVTGAGSGAIEAIVNLNGQVIPADGHFLCAESTFSLAAPAQRDFNVGPSGLNFEGGDNVTYVLATNFFGTLNQDLDTDNNGTIDVTPWSVIVDAVGVYRQANPPTNTEYTYGAALGGADVGPDAIFVPGQVYRCEPARTWTVGRFDPFDAMGGTDTPGAANPNCPAPVCVADIAPPGGNQTVNVDDLLLVINSWGACPLPCPPSCTADIAPPGGNCIVNVDDLLKVINSWGPCPP